MSSTTQVLVDRYRLMGLEQAMELLLYFRADRRIASLETLHRALGVNKAQLIRMLRTFEAIGFIIRENDGYRLGARVLALSRAYLGGLSVPEAAKPAMESLAHATGHTVSVAILDGVDVVYVAIELGGREIGIQSDVGGRHPAHATALGKVLLCAMPDEAIRDLYSGRTLERLTHRTIADIDSLLLVLSEVRAQGYATDDEERGIGIRCVAAPIFAQDRKLVAAISLAAPIFHMPLNAIPERARLAMTAAEEVSLRLGAVLD